MKARLTATALTLLMLAPSGLVSTALYLCRMDGQVRTACCCNGTADAGVNVRAAGCCDQHMSATAQAANGAPQAVNQADVSTLGSRVGSPILSAPIRRVRRALVVGAPRGPPPTGPPLYARNCTYLI